MGTGAAIILGGLLTLNLASSATMRALRFTNEAKRVKLKSETLSSLAPILFCFLSWESDFLVAVLVQRKVASPCEHCKGKGFYICKLCKANATIDWSPLYDPVAINPCLCPTCDGNRLLYDFSFILLVISQLFLELILGAWSTISFFFFSVWLLRKQVPFCSFI